MKELVCIAPDGYLELWEEQPIGGFLILDGGFYDDGFWGGLYVPTNPKFWGRIILGEL